MRILVLLVAAWTSCGCGNTHEQDALPLTDPSACGTWKCGSWQCEQVRQACLSNGHLADIAITLRAMEAKQRAIEIHKEIKP